MECSAQRIQGAEDLNGKILPFAAGQNAAHRIPQGTAVIRMSEKTSEFNSGDESEYLILPL